MATDCAKLTSLKERDNSLPSSATPESVAQNKKTILRDKSSSFANSSLKQKSSKTSPVDSTLSVKGLEPYWTEFCAETSSLLLSPTEIVSHASDLNSSSTWSSPGKERSWFSTELSILPSPNSRLISSQFSTSSRVGSTAAVATPRRARKIRIYPNAKQRAMISLWFQASRWMYNISVEILDMWEGPVGEAVYGEIMNVCGKEIPERLSTAPYQVKKIACRDAVKALKAGKKAVKEGRLEHFELGFRSRKSPVQSVYIPHSAVSELGIYHTMLGRMRSAEPLPVTPKDSRLLLDHGRYYLSTPMEVTTTDETQGGIVAIDPGVRVFASVFGIKDGEECHGHFGRGVATRIFRLCLDMDRMISQLKTLPTRARKTSLKRALNRTKWKVWDLVSEMHNQIARWLVDNFSVILLPTYETSQMTNRAERKIRSKTARQMLTLSNYKFAQQLESTATLSGVQVIRTCEAYTSKTDSWNGEIKNRGYYIKTHDVKIDRDLNGARGGLLRALVDSPALATAKSALETSFQNLE